VIERYLRHQVY